MPVAPRREGLDPLGDLLLLRHNLLAGVRDVPPALRYIRPDSLKARLEPLRGSRGGSHRPAAARGAANALAADLALRPVKIRQHRGDGAGAQYNEDDIM